MKPLVWQTSGITAPHNPSSPLPKPRPLCASSQEVLQVDLQRQQLEVKKAFKEQIQKSSASPSATHKKKTETWKKRVKLQAKMTKISKSIKHIWWHLMHAKTLSLCYEGGSLGTKVHHHGNLCCRINLLQMSACLKFEIKKKVWNHCLRTNQFYREQLQHS